jgi:SAM-dependent methyltransferase
MNGPTYFMESEEESLRLDLKTDPGVVEEQARWAGVVPGMRVADLGCGAGKTTHILHRLVQPGGEVVGIDQSQLRIDYAAEHYAASGISYVRRRRSRIPLPSGSVRSGVDSLLARVLRETFLRHRQERLSATESGRHPLSDRSRSQLPGALRRVRASGKNHAEHGARHAEAIRVRSLCRQKALQPTSTTWDASTSRCRCRPIT